MTTTLPTITPARVRPLWERSELFREPHYQHNITWDDTDDNDDDQSPNPAPNTTP